MSRPYYIREQDTSSLWGYRTWDGVAFVEFGGQGYSSLSAAKGAWQCAKRDVRGLHGLAFVSGPNGGKYALRKRTA